MNDYCHWREDEDGLWNTECGRTLGLMDSLEERKGSAFCTCGREIDAVIHISPQDIEDERGDRAYQAMKDDEP